MKNQIENVVCSLLFAAGLIIVAMFTKSGAYNFVAKIFATDIYIQGALLVLALIVGYSLISEKERNILSHVPKSVVAGIVALAFLLFAGPTVLPNISKETGMVLLKIAVAVIITATLLFLYSFTIKRGEKALQATRSKPNPA